jgi:hypothetical protein
VARSVAPAKIPAAARQQRVNGERRAAFRVALTVGRGIESETAPWLQVARLIELLLYVKGTVMGGVVDVTLGARR